MALQRCIITIIIIMGMVSIASILAPGPDPAAASSASMDPAAEGS
jgi:hypothetical protein